MDVDPAGGIGCHLRVAAVAFEVVLHQAKADIGILKWLFSITARIRAGTYCLSLIVLWLTPSTTLHLPIGRCGLDRPALAPSLLVYAQPLRQCP